MFIVGTISSKTFDVGAVYPFIKEPIINAQEKVLTLKTLKI